MATAPGWLWPASLVVGVAVSVAVLLAATRAHGRWGTRLRRRLVMGIPFGTIASTAIVLLVYLVVQHGWGNWTAPTQIPYRAWSYATPVGIVFSPFAHASPGHLIGNLLGTVTFGVLAEYAWGHFPTRRGGQTFSSLRTNPYARALAFVGGVVGVGLLTSVFSLGPVIGFSGVVFAFIGLALVRYPLATVVVLVAGDVLGLVLDAVRSPTATASAGTEFTTPWFAGIAIHGHYLGALLGVLIGVALVRRRGVRPSPSHVWLAVLAFGADQALWALYVPLDESRFLLLRAGGVVVLFALAALVTAGVRASERPLVATIDLSRREAAGGLLVAVLVALAIVAVPFNLLTVADPLAGADEPITVDDYHVYYAEDVPHQLVPSVDQSPIDGRVNVSGVIVSSPARGIWWPEITATELASRDSATLYLGGPTWRVPVRASRPAWRTIGAGTAYKVYLRAGDRPERLAFRSERASIDAVIAGRNLTIAPTVPGFDLVVSRDNRTLGRVPIPANGTSVAVGGLSIRREGRTLVARGNGTRVRIAQRNAVE